MTDCLNSVEYNASANSECDLESTWEPIKTIDIISHNDQKFQREQKKSSPIFKCKTIIYALFCHYIDVF